MHTTLQRRPLATLATFAMLCLMLPLTWSSAASAGECPLSRECCKGPALAGCGGCCPAQSAVESSTTSSRSGKVAPASNLSGASCARDLRCSCGEGSRPTSAPKPATTLAEGLSEAVYKANSGLLAAPVSALPPSFAGHRAPTPTRCPIYLRDSHLLI